MVAEKMREKLRRLEEEREGVLGRKKEEGEDEEDDRREPREPREPSELKDLKEQKGQKEQREELLRRVAESSVVFLHAFGEEIPEKVIKMLEEK